MVTKIYENPDIFKIDVPLPDNPLKNLNCYVIRDSGETLILDTGFNRDECREALLAGLDELEADWEKTHLFLTHLHSDHTGLAPALMEGKPGKIYISRIDHEILKAGMEEERWRNMDAIYFREGFSREELTTLRVSNPARGFKPPKFFEAEHICDNDRICVGNWEFRCVFVPGHTPGQMCLYCEKKKLMFTADHVLFDITPNITFWQGMKDSLGAYLDSLVKIRGFEIETALPAHRNNQTDVYTRIRQIVEHHLVRLCETVDALAEFPGTHASQIASRLQWSMRGKTWDEFPLSQRWFAVGETIAHLDYLICCGLAEKREGEQNTYRLLGSVGACKARLRELWEAYRG
ncbi:MAG: MBL fold metallo-hydrolase [Lachnospiraceae bacterium]|jgi:glyoxylase-like metal-dependent hydrolase (beta-lactamase superfamily II)|nr:MBL fold metallo-hydrolase [Lachnospiraceae bacterium]